MTREPTYTHNCSDGAGCLETSLSADAPSSGRDLAARRPQTCCKCLHSTRDYATVEYDQRTTAEKTNPRSRPIIRRFHTCSECDAVEARAMHPSYADVRRMVGA